MTPPESPRPAFGPRQTDRDYLLELTRIKTEHREQLALAWDSGFAEGVIDQARFIATGDPTPGPHAQNPYRPPRNPSPREIT